MRVTWRNPQELPIENARTTLEHLIAKYGCDGLTIRRVYRKGDKVLVALCKWGRPVYEYRHGFSPAKPVLYNRRMALFSVMYICEQKQN